MSDSVRPHRHQLTRLPGPWDSPGKNTGVGCHFLLQCMKVKVKSLSCVQLLATPWTATYQTPPSMGFSKPIQYCKIKKNNKNKEYKKIKVKKKSTGVGCHCLLRGQQNLKHKDLAIFHQRADVSFFPQS